MAAEKRPCPKCGAGNDPANRFCGSCGAPMTGALPPRPVVPPPPSAAPGAGGDSGFGGIIPLKNPSALTAYYLAVFSLIPCLGLILGIIALVLGIKGLKVFRDNPAVKGTVHAWIGIILGGLCALANIAVIILAVVTRNP